MLAAMRRVRLSHLMLLALLVLACAPEQLSGTDLGKQAAPDFTLIDGVSGARTSLSDMRGSVVTLAFLYTRCPDICPLTAERFRQAQQQLGGDADRVQLLAVSVDPEHDTPATVRDFNASHRLERNWHFLIGPRAALAPIWAAYGVRSEPDPSGLGVGHTDAIYLIDRRGRARVLLHTDSETDVIVKDIRILLRESE